MTQISNEGDATFLNRRIDRRLHNRSVLLENLVQKRFSRKVTTASLSIPGSHCSDVATLAANLLQAPRLPELVIFGIAPRDVMDNSLPAPYSTQTYHLMEKLNTPREIEDAGRPRMAEKIGFAMNHILGHLFPTYRFQEELALGFRRLVKNELDCVLASSEDCNEERKAELGFKIGDGDCTTPRYSVPNGTSPERQDLSECYRCVYNPVNESSYKLQLQFLGNFMDSCRKHGVKVLLVNMPLRKDSFDLMPTGFYERYVTDVRESAEHYGATFADLSTDREFCESDFIDQVHLSGQAAPKFLVQLADYLPLCLSGCDENSQRAIALKHIGFN
jgi:hypothetical protein